MQIVAANRTLDLHNHQACTKLLTIEAMMASMHKYSTPIMDTRLEFIANEFGPWTP